MTFKAAKRGAIAPFIVMDVMKAANNRAAAGKDVIHLEVGQPFAKAPKRVRDAAARALADHGLGYTDAMGLADLRQRIADHYREEYGASVNPDHVVVTTGSSAAFLLAFLAAFEAGDKVAVAAPGYPAYRNILAALGVDVIVLPVDASSRFQITAEILANCGHKLDGVVVASPSNPTGSMLSVAQMKQLVDHCEAQQIRLISDEIYHGISFEGPAASAAQLGEHTILVNSFSKYYAMTGWRLGWMVVPPDLLRSVECLQQNLFISAPTASQLAAIHAFDCRDELDVLVGKYRQNRDLLLNEFPSAGISKLAPSDGAFYLYADISHLTDDSLAFCSDILAKTGVAVTPGLDFDPLMGQHFMRLSYAGPFEHMREAAKRLKSYLA